jgi:outer membrane protein assembly factor BamB
MVTIAAVLAASLIVAGFIALLAPRIGQPAKHPKVTPAVPTPTVHLGGLSIYVADQSSCYALRADNGSPRWASPGCSPSVMADGILYQINTVNSVSGATTTLVKIEAGTGKILLQRQLVLPLMDSANIRVVGDSLYLTTDRVGGGSDRGEHGVYALRASDGSVRWHYPTSDPAVSLPLVADGIVYASAGTTLLALRASDGTLLWNVPLVANGNPAIGQWLASANGTLYVIAGEKLQDFPLSPTGENAFLYALRASDGGVLWRADLGGDYYTQPSAPVIANGVVYVRAGASRAERAQGNASSAHLYALNSSDGTLLWQYREDRASVTSSSGQSLKLDAVIYEPIVADGVVYTSDLFGNIVALQASDGAQLWKKQICKPDELAGLAIGGGALFASVNGELKQGVNGGPATIGAPNLLIAMRAGDGMALWQQTIGTNGPGGMGAPVVAP